MLKTIQIFNVLEDLHCRLELRAAELGMTLSDYLLSEARELAERPTLKEMLARLDEEEPVALDESPTAIIRRLRNSK